MKSLLTPNIPVPSNTCDYTALIKNTFTSLWIALFHLTSFYHYYHYYNNYYYYFLHTLFTYYSPCGVIVQRCPETPEHKPELCYFFKQQLWYHFNLTQACHSVTLKSLES